MTSDVFKVLWHSSSDLLNVVGTVHVILQAIDAITLPGLFF